jgi:hypothetical protein
MRFRFAASLILAMAIYATDARIARAVMVDEVDAFATNLEGWAQGQTSTATQGVTRVAGGGPAGGSDGFMRIIADGSSSHGKIVVFNHSAEWTGNYLAAGVARIAMDVNNLGATDLKLRVALGTGASPSSGTWFASTTPINLPAGSGWTHVQFPLSASSLTSVGGAAAYNTVMSTVATLRLLHSNSPDNNGTSITATLGVDNITALGALPGDFDKNGVVNAADLTQWRSHFAVDNGADADNDNDSDGNDFLLWQRGLGQTPSTPVVSAVPEPAALLLALCVTPLLLRRRRSK